MIDENITDPTFGNVAHGRANPTPRQPAERPKSLSFPELNIGTGSRIRVLEDNGRRGIVGLVGDVVQSYPGFVVVELDDDPMLRFRAAMPGGFVNPQRPPKRHFRVTEVEKID